ncbi:MAG TPA: helix-turn-helix transcriptional regulator [Bryobacteraceae bacterium]
MDVPLVIKHRLKDLGLGQRDLAAAAHVTESYVSQLLARKKAPPAPRRTDIYDKMEAFLQLPRGELSRLAEVQRQEELKKKIAGPAMPLFPEFRAFILRKCRPGSRPKVRAILEKEPLGELERLVAQKLLDVAKTIAKQELGNEKWLRLTARLSKRTIEQTKAMTRELLRSDVFSTSVESCIPFLDLLIENWHIDLDTFEMEMRLDGRVALGELRRFEFAEKKPAPPMAMEPGLREFLGDKTLSGDTTGEEVEFLKALQLNGKRPFPIYYYRELQNLRDPVHFRDS